ncbi:MAG TPA: RNA polymerase sigma factor [Candidatus Polarisedimenticolia bacterium]|nr:RNA polymerase sigma factor [Candidatus Polarisedimenticolia bacterium]
MERGERDRLQAMMIRLADGDRSAFHPVFELLWPLLRRFAARLLPRAEDADDAAQQALINIFSRAAAFDPRRDALSWALGIAFHECRTQRRRLSRRREIPLGAPDELPSGLDGMESLLAARLQSQAVLELLGELRPADREAVLAAVGAEGSTRPAIGAAAYRKRVQRAFARLRRAWRQRHGVV